MCPSYMIELMIVILGQIRISIIKRSFPIRCAQLTLCCSKKVNAFLQAEISKFETFVMELWHDI